MNLRPGTKSFQVEWIPDLVLQDNVDFAQNHAWDGNIHVRFVTLGAFVMDLVFALNKSTMRTLFQVALFLKTTHHFDTMHLTFFW